MIQKFSSGSSNQLTKEEFLDAIEDVSRTSIEPFSQRSIEILSLISSRLLTKRDVPQMMALGYWLRPAAIKKKLEDFLHLMPANHYPTARGTAFHLPPTNVDTLFVYSWALSLLSGNSNIIRLPSNRDEMTDWLIATVIEVLENEGDVQRHLFCSYDHNLGLNRDVSSLSDLRIIWGGDAKVVNVSKDPILPDGLSLGFPDRESLCLISAPAYAKLSASNRDKLASQFFNDVYWFDQMGCGSPRIVLWVGTRNVVETLSFEFYERLVSVAKHKEYQTATGVAIEKFTFLNEMISEGIGVNGYQFGNNLSILELDKINGRAPYRHVGGGLLSHVVIDNIRGINDFLNRKTQTITQVGFSSDELIALANNLRGRGGFRIVPVGQALAFDATWDGVDLLQHMTRKIVLTE